MAERRGVGSTHRSILRARATGLKTGWLPAHHVLAQAEAQVEPHPSSEVQAAAATPALTPVITCTSSARVFSFISMTLVSSMASLFLLMGLAGPPSERAPVSAVPGLR